MGRSINALVRASFVLVAAVVSAALSASPAAAGAGNIALVNGVGVDITAMAIRRSGTQGWKPLGIAVGSGKSGSASFADPDCAFDLQATLANGKSVTWSGVNLCDVKLLTLRRNDSGLTWVDYD